jgi:flagellar basal-body rod protein FlgG
MISGIHNLIDGSMIQKLRFDTVANNIANSSTLAFKKDTIAFDQMLSMKYFSRTDFSPGPCQYTGHRLDLALTGEGFFKIQTDKGTRYTRDGTFTLNSSGRLVTQTGHAVLGQNGPIQIEGTDVSILGDGRVMVDDQLVDRIAVVDFENLGLLEKQGGSYYNYSGGDQEIFSLDTAAMKQGYVEQSNVNATEEMIRMIETYRAFESNQKAIQSIDEITREMVNDAGRVQ